MANGWGGARRGSGPTNRKARPKQKPGTAVATVPAQPAQPVLSIERMHEIIATSRALAKRNVDPQKFNPFKLPEFPPAAMPPKAVRMAMDESSGLSWASNQWSAGGIGGFVEEGLVFPGYTYLAELAQRAEYRTFSETVATEMTRKWIKFTSVGEEKEKARKQAKDEDREPDPKDEPAEGDADDHADEIKELVDFMEHLEVRDNYAKLALQDGLYGRTHLLHDFGDVNDQQLKAPIGNGRDETTKLMVKKGSLKRLAVIEPVWTYPTTYNANDPTRADWYNPQVWYVMGKEYHRSRLRPFVGREVPDLLKPSYAFGGLSMTQMAKPYVDIWLTTRQSVADLIHSFSVMVLCTDLQVLMQPQSAAALLTRIAMFNELRDNQGAFVINKATEDFKNVAAQLSGLHELQAQAQEHMMSVARIPAVKFTGMQPEGMNASSDGEIRTWYDTINAFQGKFFRPGLTTTVDFSMISLWGKRNEKIKWDFEPLWEETSKEKGERQKAEGERDQLLVDMGAIAPEEVRKRVIDDPDMPYGELDPDDVPDLAEEEEQGLQPEGGRPNPAAEGEPDKGGGANDAVLPFGGALDDFNEADHPRGQPGNAGQFGSGGGGKSGNRKPQIAHAPQFGLQHGHFTAPSGLSGFSPASSKRGNIGAPIDASKLKKVGGQMGSNPGGVYEDDAGKKFYVKKGKSKDHVRNEMIAAALYDLAGTPTLQYRPVEGGEHVATEMSKLDKDNAGKLSKAERAEAARDFAVHAWLANYDAVGMGGDNLGTVRGVPTALDVGGALEYRAQGKPKGEAFGTKVGELDTMRDPSVNKDSAGMFGDMTPAQMRESARFVTAIKDDRIKAVVEKLGGSAALASKLIKRKEDVAARAALFGAEGDPKSPDGTMVVPVGGKTPVKALNGVKFEAWRPPADWAAVDGQEEIDEPEFKIPEHKKPSTGVIIREPDGRVWIVQPRGGYGGYEGTFPKGGLEKGLSPQANAIKEAWEESGLKVRITGFAGDHEGDMTMTRYYHATREGGDPARHEDETEGVVLVPEAKAAGFLNRKRDAAVLAHDDAQWEESKHPRAPDGKFGKGGTTGVITPEELESGRPDDDNDEEDDIEQATVKVPGGVKVGGMFIATEDLKKNGMTGFLEIAQGGEPTKPKKTAFGGLWKTGGENDHQNVILNAKHVLSKPTNAGSSYRQMLAHIIKKLGPASGQEEVVGKLKAKLGEAFKLAGEKAEKLAGENAANPDGMKYAAIAKQAYQKASDLGIVKQVPAAAPAKPAPVTKKIAEQAMKDHPAMAAIAAASKYQPTEAELEKAKKNVKLQLQFVPGAPQGSAAAQKLVDAFNAKYEGKTLVSKADLTHKVQDFKMLAAAMAPLQSAEQQQAAAKAAQQQAKQAEAAAAAEKKAAADLQKSKAQLKSLMDELGVDSEADAAAVQGLMELAGVTSSKGVLEKFTATTNPLASSGVTNFEFSLLKSYTGSAYAAVNKALRAGTWTTKQHMYVNAVNKALKKLPSYQGISKRGTTLPLAEQQKLAAGQVIVEHAFMSTSKTSPWGGNTQYVIKGKSGRDIQHISNYNSEAEVLYPARTFFQVTKVDGAPGGKMTVHLSEVEAW